MSATAYSSFYGRPEEQPTYRPRFPVIRDARQIDRVIARLAQLPLLHGYSEAFVETTWKPALEFRLAPALHDLSAYLDKIGPGGVDDLENRLDDARADLFEFLEQNFGDLGCETEELSSAVAGELLRIMKEEREAADLLQVHTPTVTQKTSELVKGLFSLPLTLMLLMIAKVHPGKSPLAWFMVLLLASGLSVVFLFISRQVANNFELIGENRRFDRDHPVASSRWFVFFKGLFFFVCAIGLAGVTSVLEAQFITENSHATVLGAKANPIPFDRALIMAGIFSGLLFVVSLAISFREASENLVRRQQTLEWLDVIKQAAPLRKLLRRLEKLFSKEKAREAELAAAADAEWFKVLYALYGFTCRVPEEKLSCFLLGGGGAGAAGSLNASNGQPSVQGGNP